MSSKSLPPTTLSTLVLINIEADLSNDLVTFNIGMSDVAILLKP